MSLFVSISYLSGRFSKNDIFSEKMNLSFSFVLSEYTTIKNWPDPFSMSKKFGDNFLSRSGRLEREG